MKSAKLCIVHTLLLIFATAVYVPNAQAEIAFLNMSTAGYKLVSGGMSSIGGRVTSTDSVLLATNMNPYQHDLSAADYAALYKSADKDLEAGLLFRNSLSLFGVTDINSNQWKLLNNTKLNYESAGIVTPEILGSLEAKLQNSRDVFSYGTYIRYPGADAKLSNLLKTLASIYLTIGDEFLSDALEYRFSDMGANVDVKLNEQIGLLSKAQHYYEKCLESFVFGFTPQANRNVYVAQYFDESTKALVNVGIERLATTVREKTSKILVKDLSPDVTTASIARKSAAETLREASASTYILASAIASMSTSETAFQQYGGQRLVNALQTLRSQSALYNQDVNPLGFDNRFVPLGEFSELLDHAVSWIGLAKQSEQALLVEKRSFDGDLDLLQQTIMNLATNTGGYKAQIAGYTGVPVSDPDFLLKATSAGDDLVDDSCPINSPTFDACIAGKTKGLLGLKYSQLRESQIRVDSAILREQNIQQKLESEERRHNERLEIYRKDLAGKKATLKQYLDDMKNSRTITKTREGKGAWKLETSFHVKNEGLGIDVDKEVALQQLNFEISVMQTDLVDEATVETLLHSLAEAQIETGLAIQVQRTAYEDFYNTYKQKNNLVFLYSKSLEQASYEKQKLLDRLPETKILHTQAALDYAKRLNASRQFAYLTAKALEYKYVSPIDQIPSLTALSMYDLYRAQTVKDVEDFITGLKTSQNCVWQGVTARLVRVSLAYNILGLTDNHLNPDKVLTAEQVQALRKERVKDYILKRVNQADKSLTINFSTALTDQNIAMWNKYNMKISYGTLPPPCPSVTSRGVAVYMNMASSGTIAPYVTLTQRGHQTFLNSRKQIQEYFPTSNYLNLRLNSDPYSINDGVVTTAYFDAFYKTVPTNVAMWDPSFNNRSIAASDWEMTITDYAYRGEPAIDWESIDDIEIYFDTIGSNLQLN